MSKKHISKIIQFSIRTQFSAIWPIDMTQSVAITLGQSGPGINGNKVYPALPKTPVLLEPQQQIV